MGKRTTDSTKQNMFAVSREKKVPANKEPEETVSKEKNKKPTVKTSRQSGSKQNQPVVKESQTKSKNNIIEEKIEEKTSPQIELETIKENIQSQEPEVPADLNLEEFFGLSKRKGSNTSIYLDDDVLTFLNESSKKLGVSKSKILNTIVKAYMKKNHE